MTLWLPTSYLYVIMLGPDRIKVGQSSSPAKRLATHRRTAEAHGVKPGRAWVSAGCSDEDRQEEQLINACAQRAIQRFGREYFEGVAFLTAVGLARTITGDRGTFFRRKPGSVRDGVEAPRRSKRGACLPEDRALGSIEEAARWLGISETRVRGLVDKGLLRVVQLGGKEKIPVISMQQWLSTRQ